MGEPMFIAVDEQQQTRFLLAAVQPSFKVIRKEKAVFNGKAKQLCAIWFSSAPFAAQLRAENKQVNLVTVSCCMSEGEISHASLHKVHVAHMLR